MSETAVVQHSPTKSERFSQMVIKEYQSVCNSHFSLREQELIAGYFVTIDATLKAAESKRDAQNQKNRDHRYDNNLPFTWENVDLQTLSRDVASYAKLGFDMRQDNTLFAIPFKDTKTNKYQITLMKGYNGLRYEAQHYAVTPFKDAIVEVVYETDTFRPIKKDFRNPIESYEFIINNAFDRGKPVGVFGYLVFEDATLNKLIIFNEKEILKRKPSKASATFWGQMDEKGNPSEENDGWREQMYRKTMLRELFSAKNIPRDPNRNAEMEYLDKREKESARLMVESEIDENANATELELPPAPKTATVNAPAEISMKIADIPAPHSPMNLADPGF